MPHKLVNHTLVEMTAEEIASREEIQAIITAKRTAFKEAEEKKITDKATGNQKLKDLGLTDDEISALTG